MKKKMKNCETNLCTMYDLLLFKSSLIRVVSVRRWPSILYFLYCSEVVSSFLHCLTLLCGCWLLWVSNYSVFLFQFEYDLQGPLIACNLISLHVCWRVALYSQCSFLVSHMSLFPPIVFFSRCLILCLWCRSFPFDS